MAKTWFKQSVTFSECFVAQELVSNGKFFEFYLYQKLLEIVFKNNQEKVTVNLKFLSRNVGKKLDKCIRSLEDLHDICSRSTDDSPKIQLRFTKDLLEIVAPNLLKLQESTLQTRLDKTRLDKNIYNEQSAILETKPPNASDQGEPDPVIEKPKRILKPKPKSNFDLEAAYQAYPRKLGKSPGLKRLAREITTESEYRSFMESVLKYKKHCEENRIEARFIKHFSTFISEWRDWAEPLTGTSESFCEENPLEEWKRRQDAIDQEEEKRRQGFYVS